MKTTVLTAMIPLANGPYPGAMVPACAMATKNFVTVASGDGTAIVEVESDHAAVAALADCIELATAGQEHLKTTIDTRGKSAKLVAAVAAATKGNQTRAELVKSLTGKAPHAPDSPSP